jgi:hypothetical protein
VVNPKVLCAVILSIATINAASEPTSIVHASNCPPQTVELPPHVSAFTSLDMGTSSNIPLSLLPMIPLYSIAQQAHAWHRLQATCVMVDSIRYVLFLSSFIYFDPIFLYLYPTSEIAKAVSQTKQGRASFACLKHACLAYHFPIY